MIIGLTGTFGAGKTTVANYLVKGHGFAYHSCSDTLRDIAKERGIPENRDTLRDLGNDIRREFGEGELARRLIEKITSHQETLAIVDSIRHPKEIEALRKNPGFVLIALDAPPEVRYARIQARGRAGDDVTFEKFLAQEKIELEGSGDAAQQIGACMKLADFHVQNGGTLEELYQRIEEILVAQNK